VTGGGSEPSRRAPYQFIREFRLRRAAQGGAVPAVALTAYARTEDRLRALRAGFQLHLAKPVHPSELVTVVSSLATRRNGRGLFYRGRRPWITLIRMTATARKRRTWSKPPMV
jgi:DNA-binding response OmpR family regulator